METAAAKEEPASTPSTETVASEREQNPQFHCNKCKKGFNNLFDLAVHIFGHTQKNRLRCAECPRSHVCIGAIELELHVNEVHNPDILRRVLLCHPSTIETVFKFTDNDDTPAFCCGKQYHAVVELSQHFRTEEHLARCQRQLVCELCQLMFGNKNVAEGGIFQHTNFSDECMFRHLKCFEVHNDKTDFGGWSCATCYLQSNTGSEMRKHLAENHLSKEELAKKGLKRNPILFLDLVSSDSEDEQGTPKEKKMDLRFDPFSF